MSKDLTLQCEDGIVNIRVGAIIMQNGKILMVKNNIHPEYYYSVGGRVKFGESAEEAVKREVFEELNLNLEIDRLGFVQENFFYADAYGKPNQLFYEIDFFFYMKLPEDFAFEPKSFKEGENDEFLEWIDINGPEKYYPECFRTELANTVPYVKHLLKDERNE